MAPPMFTISTARQRFFDLFERVTTGHGRKVIITSRGIPTHAVLVGEDYLKELESAAKKLRALEAGHAPPNDGFRLVGSGRIAEGIDDPLADVRTQANESWERKLKRLAKAS